MGQDTDQIERQIARERQDLGRNLNELERRAKDLTDWRAYYRQNPMLFLGAAIGGGLILGVLASPRESARSGYDAQEFEVRNPHGIRSRVSRQADQTWERVSDTLLDLAAGKLIEFVGQVVPGFKEHYGRGTDDYPFRSVNLRDASMR
jgi:hypothetical protein